jgi:hypothetical protein
MRVPRTSHLATRNLIGKPSEKKMRMKMLNLLQRTFHFSFLSKTKAKKEIKNHKKGENKKASSLDRIKNIFKYIDSIEVEFTIFAP